MPIGLVTTMAAVMALGMPRLRLRPPVPDASRRARSLALAARLPEISRRSGAASLVRHGLFLESQRR
jgi:hypothetical protein